MYKFAVMGKDSGKLLNQLLTANVNGDVGVITYTQWLNEMGQMEADLTVTKLSNDHFLVVATDTQHNQVATRLRRHLCDGDDDRHRLDASILDVTGAYCQSTYRVQSRGSFCLQELTSQDLGNKAFPFRKVTEIDIGFARVI